MTSRKQVLKLLLQRFYNTCVYDLSRETDRSKQHYQGHTTTHSLALEHVIKQKQANPQRRTSPHILPDDKRCWETAVCTQPTQNTGDTRNSDISKGPPHP